jgi:hypothetical protein
MESLEVVMKNDNINLDPLYSNSSSHRMNFFLLFFPLMQHLLLLLISGLLSLKHLIIWLRIKLYFLFLINSTQIIYLLVMIDLLML